MSEQAAGRHRQHRVELTELRLRQVQGQSIRATKYACQRSLHAVVGSKRPAESSPVCADVEIKRTTVSTWPLHWRMGGNTGHLSMATQSNLHFTPPMNPAKQLRPLPARAKLAVEWPPAAQHAAKPNPGACPQSASPAGSPRHHHIQPRLVHQELLGIAAILGAHVPLLAAWERGNGGGASAWHRHWGRCARVHPSTAPTPMQRAACWSI